MDTNRLDTTMNQLKWPLFLLMSALAINSLYVSPPAVISTLVRNFTIKETSYNLPRGIYVIFHSQQLNRSIGKPTWFINRLRTDRYWIQALLTISCSGSILNPGPTKFPCGYCSKPVINQIKKLFVVTTVMCGTTFAVWICLPKSTKR